MIFPQHWHLRGPYKVKRVDRLFRDGRNTSDGHVSAVYRLVRIGPWTLLLFRYRAGYVDEINP